MSTLNSRIQLSILNRKKGRNLLEKGFTLVELMIVIVVVGVLSAVALPNFLGVKDKAVAASQVGEFVGLAKECSTAIIIEGPYPATYGTNPNISGDCNGGTTASAPPTTSNIDFTGDTIPANSDSTVACGPDIKVAKTEACKITVDTVTGQMSFAKA